VLDLKGKYPPPSSTVLQDCGVKAACLADGCTQLPVSCSKCSQTLTDTRNSVIAKDMSAQGRGAPVRIEYSEIGVTVEVDIETGAVSFIDGGFKAKVTPTEQLYRVAAQMNFKLTATQVTNTLYTEEAERGAPAISWADIKYIDCDAAPDDYKKRVGILCAVDQYTSDILGSYFPVTYSANSDSVGVLVTLYALKYFTVYLRSEKRVLAYLVADLARCIGNDYDTHYAPIPLSVSGDKALLLQLNPCVSLYAAAGQIAVPLLTTDLHVDVTDSAVQLNGSEMLYVNGSTKECYQLSFSMTADEAAQYVSDRVLYSSYTGWTYAYSDVEGLTYEQNAPLVYMKIDPAARYFIIEY